MQLDRRSDSPSEFIVIVVTPSEWSLTLGGVSFLLMRTRLSARHGALLSYTMGTCIVFSDFLLGFVEPSASFRFDNCNLAFHFVKPLGRNTFYYDKLFIDCILLFRAFITFVFNYVIAAYVFCSMPGCNPYEGRDVVSLIHSSACLFALGLMHN